MAKGNKFKPPVDRGSNNGSELVNIASELEPLRSDQVVASRQHTTRKATHATSSQTQQSAASATAQMGGANLVGGQSVVKKKGKSGAARKQLAKSKRRAAERLLHLQSSAAVDGPGARSAAGHVGLKRSIRANAMRAARRRKAALKSPAKKPIEEHACAQTASSTKAAESIIPIQTGTETGILPVPDEAAARPLPTDADAADAANTDKSAVNDPPRTLTDKTQRINSNWAVLRGQLRTTHQSFRQHKKRQRAADDAAAASAETCAAPAEARGKAPQALREDSSLTPVVAVDCEMVGVGPDGSRSELARVCIVNNHGTVLMDQFAKPKERVTDFRTRFSGIRPADIRVAPPFQDVQRQAAAILSGRIVVGHSISNDLKALLLGHPGKHIRDTARFPPLMLPRRPGGRARPRALREIAAEQLGLTIQTGEHSPVEDARAALYLYHKFRKEWEAELKQHGSTKRLKSQMAGMGRQTAARSLAQLARNDSMVDL